MTRLRKVLTKYFSYPDNRDAIYDYIRVMSCIGIVGIHTVTGYHNAESVFLETIFRPALPLFFIISGALLLGGKESSSDEHIGAFYLRRFEAVILPFLIYVALWECWLGTGHLLGEIPTPADLVVSIRALPEALLKNLTSLNIEHFWFMYELIGLYLISPFLKKGLHALSFSFLKKLFLVSLIVLAVSCYLPMFTGTGLYFTNYFAAWSIYYILGYILTRKEMAPYYPALAVAGGVGFLFMLFWRYYHPELDVTGFYYMQPHMILCASGIVALFMMYQKQLTCSKKLNWVMMHLGKYSFFIYIFHFSFLWYYQIIHPEYGESFWGILLVVLIVFGKSLLAGIIFDNLITFNIQRLFRLLVKGLKKLFSNASLHSMR